MNERKINNFIKIAEKHKRDLLLKSMMYMMNSIEFNKYIIFQSNFTFCNTDIPFTIIVDRTNPNMDVITECCVDWAAFHIDDFDNGIGISDEWVTNDEFCDDEKIDKEKNAKYYVDFNSGNDFIHNNLANTIITYSYEQTLLRIYDLLVKEYGYEEDDNHDPSFDYSGIIAIIYSEPLDKEKDIASLL